MPSQTLVTSKGPKNHNTQLPRSFAVLVPSWLTSEELLATSQNAVQEANPPRRIPYRGVNKDATRRNKKLQNHTEEMRDLKSLLESQEVDLDQNTIRRALELNGELAKLKEENEKLKKENRLRKDKEEFYVEELEQSKEQSTAYEAEVKRLQEETHRLKVSLDSVFKDLEASKQLVAKLRKERFDKKFGQEDSVSDPVLKDESQAQLLAPVVEKATQSLNIFSNIGVASSAQQRKIHNLEKENAALKSELVRLQSECREERYLNRKAIEELTEENSTFATVSLDGSFSHTDESDDCNSTSDRHSRRSNLARSNSLRRIKEYKERKATSPTNMITTGASIVRQPQRIGSLRSNLPRGRRMVDADDDDRPLALRGGPAGPQRVQSLWPVGAPGARSPLSPAEASPAIPRGPRRIQSLQPTSLIGEQINLHDLGRDEPSRGSLITRSQESIRRMGWWQ